MPYHTWNEDTACFGDLTWLFPLQHAAPRHLTACFHYPTPPTPPFTQKILPRMDRTHSMEHSFLASLLLGQDREILILFPSDRDRGRHPQKLLPPDKNITCLGDSKHAAFIIIHHHSGVAWQAHLPAL